MRIRQTDAQVAFAQALTRVLAEQNHMLTVNLMRSDVVVIKEINAMGSRNDERLGGAGVREFPGGTVTVSLRFEVVRSGSDQPARISLPSLFEPTVELEEETPIDA